MEIVIGSEILEQYSIKNVSSIDELRKILFLCRSNSAIAPDKNGCSEYNLEYGEIMHTHRGPAVAVGTYRCKLWFQLAEDDGKVSFWDPIYSSSIFTEKSPRTTNKIVEPHYMTHYELYTILHCADKYIYTDNIVLLRFSYPIYPSIFLPSEILYSKDEENISETKDHISSLPLDTIADIFEHCDPLNVFYSMLVCRSWYMQIKQCGVWKRFCKRSGIMYNEKILNRDYDGNQAEYYFSRGLERRLTINIIPDIHLFCNKKYYLGGLYWILNLDDETLYIKLCDLPFDDFSDIKISILIKISMHNKDFEVCAKYESLQGRLNILTLHEIYSEYDSCLRRLNISTPQSLTPPKCIITVRVHGSLISLMHKITLE